jgi:hypothetical protein
MVAFPDQDGIFAECKPVGPRRAVGGHYCDRGLQRFLTGEYAWAMREGVMVAYAVAGYELNPALRDALAWGDRPTRIPLTAGPTPIPRMAASPYAQLPHRTVHPRNFQYVDTKNQAPEITIHHLWLMRT